MRIICGILLFCIIFVKTSGQINLVPNPSFESYDSCPDSDGQITRSLPWFQPYLPFSSSDYFNACSIDTISHVPNNYFGIQQARTGNAYAGITVGFFSGNNYREYIEIELDTSLHQGWKYEFKMYVSLCDYCYRATDAIGAFFSNSIVTYNNPPWGLLNFTPQVNNTPGNIIIDTANWVLVVDTFVSQGGEKYLVIGNFLSDSATNWINYNPGALYFYSNYYIDDVSVTLIDSTLEIDELIDNGLILFPNPASEIIQIDLRGKFQEGVMIRLYSAIGDLIIERPFTSNLNISHLSKGLYFLSINTDKGDLVRKVMKF